MQLYIRSNVTFCIHTAWCLLLERQGHHVKGMVTQGARARMCVPTRTKRHAHARAHAHTRAHAHAHARANAHTHTRTCTCTCTCTRNDHNRESRVEKILKWGSGAIRSDMCPVLGCKVKRIPSGSHLSRQIPQSSTLLTLTTILPNEAIVYCV